MNLFTRTAAALVLGLGLATAQAETADEAKSLLDAAVAAFKAKGKDATIKEINAGGKWNKGSLYVVAVQYDGVMLAHSANDKMAGKNMLEAKDAAGKFFVKDTISAVKSAGNGQVDMRWGNPVTKQIGDAMMFSKAVPASEVPVEVRASRRMALFAKFSSFQSSTRAEPSCSKRFGRTKPTPLPLRVGPTIRMWP